MSCTCRSGRMTLAVLPRCCEGGYLSFSKCLLPHCACDTSSHLFPWQQLLFVQQTNLASLRTKSLRKYSSTVSNRSTTTLLLLYFVYLFCFVLHYTHRILHFIVYLYKSDYIKPYFILMLCYVILLYNICYVILYHNTNIASLYLIFNTTSSSTNIILMLHWLVIFYVTLLSHLYI